MFSVADEAYDPEKGECVILVIPLYRVSGINVVVIFGCIFELFRVNDEGLRAGVFNLFSCCGPHYNSKLGWQTPWPNPHWLQLFAPQVGL